MANKLTIGFIGQGWIGKNYANDFEQRGYSVIRYALEAPYHLNKGLIKTCGIVFIAVPTPTVSEGVDVTIIEKVLPLLADGTIAVIKSTISPGTTKELQGKNSNIFILHSPEFLVESTAAYDAAHPDRNIIGVPFWSEEHKIAANKVMEILPNAPYSLICDSHESEIIKYAHNVHGFLQVVFSNMLFDLSSSFGSSWNPIKDALLHDPMMSHYYLDPYHKKGRGAGGDCFIKDFEAFIKIYQRVTGDEDGVHALRYFERKNTKLLVGTKKDLPILQSVYGKALRGVRLLIITQKIDKDDSYFGFFHAWVNSFASLCEQVTVLSLEVGTYDLPDNVQVISMGKENGRSVFKYLYRYYKTLIQKRNAYDMVFAHMSPWYVILGSMVFKLLKKKTALWYVHRHVDIKLRVAHWMSDIIFTATKESYGILSQKVKYLGQAVVVEDFENPQVQNSDTVLRLITVGRITRIKNLALLLEILQDLKKKKIPVHLTIVGEAITADDQVYKKTLFETIDTNDLNSMVTFTGAIPHAELPAWYAKSDLSINLCPTGGMDKAVLEAMAASLPVLVTNEAFRNHLGPFVDLLMFREGDAVDAAQKIAALQDSDLRRKTGTFLYTEVKRRSGLQYLISKVVYHLSSI